MKKVIILSVAAVAVLFLSLAINTNVKNNASSIDLKSALQSANATTAWVHDCSDMFSAWGLSNLKATDPIWYNCPLGYQPIGQSYSYQYGWEYLGGVVRPCCLWCGENNGGEACTTSTQLTTYGYSTTYDYETGQSSTTYTTRSRTTKIFGRNQL